MEFNDELILIDGNSLINRAYYALPMLTSEKASRAARYTALRTCSCA